MYCPSCDKTYGPIHSRCPECHSWLKVSAPGKDRPKASVGAAPGNSAEMERGRSTQPAHSPSPPSRSPAPELAAPSRAPELSPPSSLRAPDPAPAASGWGATPAARDSGGWNIPTEVKNGAPPSLSAPSGEAWSSERDSAWASPSPVPASPGWGHPEPAAPAAAAPAPTPPPSGHGWLDSMGGQDSWGGGGLASEPPVTSSKSPKSPARADSASGSWVQEQGNGTGHGWMGGEDPGQGGGAWLGDVASAPSIADMVDRAIHNEDDEFVDDSWVDEEIRDSEFDELEVHDAIPPATEIGGFAIKLLLAAMLFLLVGGGYMVLSKETKTPEQVEAEKVQAKLEFGRKIVEDGKADLKADKPKLAAPQFQNAMVALSEGKAPQEEIFEAEVLLSRALMKSKDYEDAHKHWKSLKASGQKSIVEEANKGLLETKRQLRAVAEGYLKEAKPQAAKGEILSVKRLGEDALDLYKKYGGSPAQIADAHAVIGRSYINSREYPAAKEQFKKAVALAPRAGYQTYLAKVNAELQPTSYIVPMQHQQPQYVDEPAYTPSTPSRPTYNPSVSVGQPSGIPTGRRVGGGYSGGGNSNNSSSSSSSGSVEPPRMKSIPTYRPAPDRNSGGVRKGAQGVVESYR